MTKKRIVLGSVSDSGIFKTIEKNLNYYNYEVINIVTNSQFKYPNAKIWIKAKIAQIIGNKQYKKQLRDEFRCAEVNKRLASYANVDYALFTSAQIYSNEALSLVKEKVMRKMVNFQQDGMKRFKSIWRVIHYFDRFFVFDRDDLMENPHLLSATNFYFDYNLAQEEPVKYDFYFLGTHIESRQNAIKQFGEYAEKHNLILNFNIACKKRKQFILRRRVYQNKQIKLISKNIDYETNLKFAKQSKVLVDFVIGEHKGLSYRVFEALGYDKKLITTNETVKHYDFYHPNNIFVWNGEDLSGLEAFLAKPYQPIDEAIKKKYSFGNWLNYMLDIQPHTPITLPKM